MKSSRAERRAAAHAAVDLVLAEKAAAEHADVVAKQAAEARRRRKLDVALAAGRSAGVIADKAAGTTERFTRERREETRRGRKRKPFDVVRASRAVDPLFDLARRMGLDERQRMAAIAFRDAAEDVVTTVRSPLDPDKVFGACALGPSANALAAADRLAGARTLLGQLQFDIVEIIVARGMNIAKVTTIVDDIGSDDRRRRSEARGRTSWLLKDALTRLADRWWPRNRGRRIHAHMEADARPTAGDEFRREVERGVVAHAMGSRATRG